MPIRLSEPPAPAVADVLRARPEMWTGAPRTEGPLKPPPKKFVGELQTALTPHLVRVQKQLDDGGAVSVTAGAAYELYGKMLKGEELKPGDIATLSLFIDELGGDEPAAAREGILKRFKAHTVHGGIADETSIYHINANAKDLLKMQENLAGLRNKCYTYLSGDDPDKPKGWWKHGSERIFTDAYFSSLVPEEYDKEIEKLAQQEFSNPYDRLNDDQKRHVYETAAEHLASKFSSDTVDHLMRQSLDARTTNGAPAMNEIIEEGRDRDPSDPLHRISELGEANKAKMMQIGRGDEWKNYQDPSITIDAMKYRLLDLDKTNRMDRNLIPTDTFMQVAIEHYGLTPIGNAPRVTDQQVLDAIKGGGQIAAIDLRGKVLRNAGHQRLMEEDAGTPDKLKKHRVGETLHMTREHASSLSTIDTAQALLLQYGNAECDDPVTFFKTKFGVDDPTAQKMYDELAAKNLLIDNNGGRHSRAVGDHGFVGARIQIDETRIGSIDSPELWAIAVDKGRLNEATLKAQIDAQLLPRFPKSKERKVEVQAVMDKYKAAAKALHPRATDSDQRESMAGWNINSLAIWLMFSGSMFAQLSNNIDPTTRREVSEYYQ